MAMFTSAAAGEAKKGMPCVGVSIGMDRIFAIVWPKWVERGMRSKEVMAYVMAAGDGLIKERMELVQELREAGIKVGPFLSHLENLRGLITFDVAKTDFLAKNKPKLPAQFAAGERDEVPFAIILGADELKAGLVKVKVQRWQLTDGKKTKVEDTDTGREVKRAELVDWLKDTQVYKEWSTGKWL